MSCSPPSLSLVVLSLIAFCSTPSPAAASMASGHRGASSRAALSHVPPPKPVPLRYVGRFSGDPAAALHHAAVPADVAAVLRTIPEDALQMTAKRHSAGSYRVVGAREHGKLQVLALTVKLAGGEKQLFRSPDVADGQWIDGAGHILSPAAFVRPVAGGRMTSPFGWRVHPVLGDWRFHYGVDFALPKGSPVFAAENGQVEEVGLHGNYGRLVRLRHPQGTETVYAHLDGFAHGIKVGSRVKRGQLIAYVGDSGLATGPHLYWEAERNEDYIDPLRLLAGPKTLPHHQFNELRKSAADAEKAMDGEKSCRRDC